MIRLLSIFLFFLVNFSLSGQNLNSKRYVKTDSFKCEFFVSNKSIRNLFVHDSVAYYWCKAQKVFATQGGYSGQLIDGEFTKFYHSGQLAEHGNFRMGLRHGEWKFWNADGVLKQVCKYQHGKINGRLVVYGQDGRIIKQEKYRNGKLKLKRDKNRLVKKEKKEVPNQESNEKIKIKVRIKQFIDSKKSKEVSGVVESKNRINE